MSWLLTSAAREHSLTACAHPDNTPSLTEIAWSLAHINRFTGHACRSYSVAEHSLLVADIAHAQGAGKLAELLCLMHDAHECITGDTASPVKQMLGLAWKAFEDLHQDRLLAAYELLEDFHRHASFIKHCDLVALATERRDLLPFDTAIHRPWPVIDTPGAEILPWADCALMQPSHVLRTASQWAARFEARATLLMEAVQFEARVTQ